MDINDVHNIVLFYLNKDQNIYLSHEEIDDVLDRAQMVLFNQYHTNPKLPAQTQAALYGESQRVDDALSPFKDLFTFAPGQSPVSITTGGIINLPTNYQHLISLYTTTFNSTLGRNVYSGVQVLNEEELIERLESQVIPVSSGDPIAIMNKQNKIQLFPPTGATGGVYYFRRPLKPIFSYTQSGRVITYDPNTSVDLEWKDMDVNNVISIALSYFGLNMSAADVVQFAQVKTQEGQ
jgi:hypothetical protein